MTNENFRRELNQVFDQVSGSADPALRERVRGAVGNAPEARGSYWIAGVATVVIAVLIVGVLVVAGPLRPRTPFVGGVSHGSPSPQASPSGAPASPSPSPVPTPSQETFTCAAQSFVSKAGGPSAPPVVFVSALRTGGHGTYDRLTIEFSNGAPGQVEISTPSAGTTFTASPSGMQLTLKGDHGILVRINGADLHTVYTGSIDIVTGDPALAEVRRVEDFEGVVQLGLGVNGAGCYHAYWLTGPDRLVIDVQTGG